MPHALPNRPIDATLSVTKAARLLGVTERSIHRYARGLQPVPHTMAVVLFALYTGKITTAQIDEPYGTAWDGPPPVVHVHPGTLVTEHSGKPLGRFEASEVHVVAGWAGIAVSGLRTGSQGGGAPSLSIHGLRLSTGRTPVPWPSKQGRVFQFDETGSHEHDVSEAASHCLGIEVPGRGPVVRVEARYEPHVVRVVGRNEVNLID